MRTIPDPASEQIGRELSLVESAVVMVAEGHARRMQLGGLAFGTAILAAARALGEAWGVRVLPVWDLGDHCVGMTFELAGGVTAIHA